MSRATMIIGQIYTQIQNLTSTRQVLPTTTNDDGSNNVHQPVLSVREEALYQVCYQNFLQGNKFLTKLSRFIRTGYLKHMARYAHPVQLRADIKIREEGADGISLRNKTIVITGANSGVGQQIATYCAAKEAAKIIMVCRSAEKATLAKQEIEALTQHGNIQIVLCDLAELSQIDAAVKEITDDTIDCIVCNAGVLLTDEKTSKEGWELTFASHLMGGTYYLCKLLLPKLQKSTDARIVIVSSGGMYNTKVPDWNTMTSYSQNQDERTKSSFQYDGNLAYAYAKRGQVILAEAWSTEFPNMITVTAHPGWTNTPAVDEAYGENKKYLEPMRDPWQGAEGIAWLVGTEKANLQSGALYLDRSVQRKHLAGPFFSEGGFTKNTKEEVQIFLDHLKKATGV